MSAECRVQSAEKEKVAQHPQLSTQHLRRYARHIVLSEIGAEGQKRLLAASVLVIGAGGLGSSVLGALAASGIGRIGIVEPDRVELSNLQRQMLFETSDIGRLKAEAARDRIEEINGDCKVELFPQRLDETNARQLIHQFFPLSRLRGRVGEGVNGNENTHQAPLPNPPPQAGEGIVVDCSDNFATRFALQDACFHKQKTLISAAISGFSAQLSTFKAHLGAPHPCYRCFISETPEREISCAQEGIVGPLAGMMGNMQALEVIKELLGIGTSLSGFILTFDALTQTTKKIGLPRDPSCPLCA